MALTADVVIIGGGATGTSIAFHLAARGVRDVIVVDKGFVASGATGKSSACVRQHYSTTETCRMIRYSLDVFARFEDLTGGGSDRALTADVVIIGGGATGTSIAFHLAARGVRDVIVVDKGFVASGATGKSSACVRQHYSTTETCRMIRYSLDVFERFEDLTGGGSCGFRRTGYLLGVDERMQ